jgi:heptaprenyl diphosphate synthase
LQNLKDNHRSSRAVICGQYAMYISLAFIFSYLEGLVPLPIPFPGIRLGLANIIIVIVLYRQGFLSALGISVVRNILTALTFGNPYMFLYSMAGSLLSLMIMGVLKRYTKFSIPSISCAGGILHNMGQLLVAMLTVGTSALWGYLPILYFAGAITGILMGIVAYECMKRIKRLAI